MGKILKETPPMFKVLEEKDPEFFKHFMKTLDMALEPGALDTKTKALIALAVDAFRGQSGGVSILTRIARKKGVTVKEIAEAVRVAFLVGGVAGMATSLYAFAG